MSTENYVARAWDNRFQLERTRSSGERFAVGFALGAILTAIMFLWIEVAYATGFVFAF